MACNPWQWYGPAQIASAAQAPQSAVEQSWPAVAQAMYDRGLWSEDDQIAAIGTIAIETASTFLPIHEYGSEADWAGYDGGPDYAGRGYPQLTHKYNYQAAGDAIGMNLVREKGGDPDLMLQVQPSALAFAWFYATHGVPSKDGSHYYSFTELADEPDYYWFRMGWCGSSAGSSRMTAIRAALLSSSSVSENRLYVPDIPDSVILQQNDWTCSVRSTYGALWSLQQKNLGPPVTYGDEGPNDVYAWMVPALCDANVGLHFADGHEIVSMLNAKGYRAYARYPALLSEAQSVAGTKAALLGGASWYHWVELNGVQPDGTLILENPAPGYKGIEDELRDSWRALGPMTVIVVEPGANAPVPPDPETEPEPEPPDDVESYEELQTLVGCSYHEQGNVIPALVAATQQLDPATVKAEVENVVSWLRANNPDPGR